MAQYDPTNPDHRALMWLTNEQLRKRGISDEQIAELRSAQQNAPADTTPPASSPAPSLVATALDQGASTPPIQRPRRTGGAPEATEQAG